jgi:hypothetical protein
MGCIFFKSGVDKINTSDIPTNLWNLDVKDIDGVSRKMEDFKENNKAFIFVNVACR